MRDGRYGRYLSVSGMTKANECRPMQFVCCKKRAVKSAPGFPGYFRDICCLPVLAGHLIIAVDGKKLHGKYQIVKTVLIGPRIAFSTDRNDVFMSICELIRLTTAC